MEKLLKVSLPKEYRGIFITDIHGNYELFSKLLEKAAFSDTDYLFIGGDLVEKGLENLKTLRQILLLTEKNSRVYVTEGNCDWHVLFLLAHPEKIIPYLNWRKESLLNEMLIEIGKTVADFSSGEEVVKILTQHFSREFKFLADLPSAIETEDFILVHAALENRQDWRETSRDFALVTPNFLNLGHQATKPVIVGHFPVSNYAKTYDVFSNQPILDKNKQIFALDGGNGVKDEGQLNALIMEKKSMHINYHSIEVDDFPKLTLQQDASVGNQLNTGNFVYPDFQVNFITFGEAFSLVEKEKTGEKVWVKNELLKKTEKGWRVMKDTTSHFLDVKSGDTVSIIAKMPDGYIYGMKDGILGWLPEKLFS